MKSIDEIKNEVAVSYNYKDWKQVVLMFLSEEISLKAFYRAENEAMHEYAKQVAEAQRGACAENYLTNLDRIQVLNTSLVTDNI